MDLSSILEGLLEADVDFILVGGLAAVIQGAPITTMDVDIVHRRSPGNTSRLLQFLKSIEIEFVGELSMTAAGKTIRRELREK